MMSTCQEERTEVCLHTEDLGQGIIFLLVHTNSELPEAAQGMSEAIHNRDGSSTLSTTGEWQQRPRQYPDPDGWSLPDKHARTRFDFHTWVVLHESSPHNQYTAKRAQTLHRQTCCDEENGELSECREGVGRGTCVTLAKHERASAAIRLFLSAFTRYRSLFCSGTRRFCPRFSGLNLSLELGAARSKRRTHE